MARNGGFSWRNLLIGLACVAVIGSSAFAIADGVEKRVDENNTQIETEVETDTENDTVAE